MNLHLSDTLIVGEVTLASMRGGGEELGRQLTE